MGLTSYPHTVLVETIQEDAANDLSVPVPTYATAVSVRGQLTPKSMGAAFQETGLNLRRPHKWMMDLGKERSFTVNSRVRFGSRVFYVATPWRRHEAGNAMDHSSVMLDEVEVA